MNKTLSTLLAAVGFLVGGVLCCTKVGKKLNDNLNEAVKFGNKHL